MKVYIVATYTETCSDSWLYAKAFKTAEDAQDWINKDKEKTDDDEHVTYEIFTDTI